MKLRPTGDNIVIKPTIREERSAGGIFIPQIAQEGGPITGEVLAVGKGTYHHSANPGDTAGWRPCDVKPGDKVVFRKFAGVEYEIDGEKFLLLKNHEVIGVFE